MISDLANKLKLVMALFVLTIVSCGGGGGSGSKSSDSPVAPGMCYSVTYAAPSGAQNNITFTFDKAYQCGQYANGDWWVSVGGNGFVKIMSITPDGVAGKHGFEVNPAQVNKQAFDIDGVVPYDSTLMPSLPLSLSGISSVLKTVSILPTPILPPKLQFAAVLTVLNAPLANSEQYFRPTYVGGTAQKILFGVANIRANLLPKLAATGINGASSLPISSVVGNYAGVWPDHISGWTGRYMHPKDNMPDYGADIAVQNATNLLRLILDDYDYTQPSHKQALINYLQMAIDLQGAVSNGTRWGDGGGQSNGRKLPLAFASWIFNDSRFQDAIVNGTFQEDFGVYRSSVTGSVLYGDPGTELQYWQHTRYGTGARTIRDPYQQIDGGGSEIGAAYQICCTAMPWKYTVLAVYRLGIASQFNNTILPEYVERWVSAGVVSQPDTCAPYDGNPNNYGVTYGPDGVGGCIQDANPADGVGRWPSVHGTQIDGGLYRSTFGDALWLWHKAHP